MAEQYTLQLGVDTGLGRADVEALQQSLTRVGRTSDDIHGKSERSTRATERFSEATGKAARSTRSAATATDGFTRSTRGLDSSLSRTVKRLAGYAAAYLSVREAARLAGSAVTNFTDVESGLVGVRKTTDLATSELSLLYEEVLDLATGPVPLASAELLELAETSGQLGVRGRDNLIAYTETLGQLSAATDVIGSEGAKQLTRLLNVQGEMPEQIKETGAALTALGNDAAATEAEILRVATEVGLSTAQFQIGSVNALALGTALKEMGGRAESGGTAVGRVLREIQAAVATGGDQLQLFAETAGLSVDEFIQSFQDAPLDAFLAFFAGLSEQGQDATLTLESLGLNTDRLAKVLPVLATNYQTLAGRVEQANVEAAKGTALEIEAQRAFDQTSADLDRLKNAYTAVSAEVGEGLSPALREVAIDLRDYLLTNREAAEELGENLGEALKDVVAIVKVLADNIDLLVIAAKTLVAVKVASTLATWTRELHALAAAGGTAQLALAPLVGVATAIGLLVDWRLDEWADRSAQEIEGMVEQSDRLRSAIEGINQELSDGELTEETLAGVTAQWLAASEAISEQEGAIDSLQRKLEEARADLPDEDSAAALAPSPQTRSQRIEIGRMERELEREQEALRDLQHEYTVLDGTLAKAGKGLDEFSDKARDATDTTIETGGATGGLSSEIQEAVDAMALQIREQEALTEALSAGGEQYDVLATLLEAGIPLEQALTGAYDEQAEKLLAVSEALGALVANRQAASDLAEQAAANERELAAAIREVELESAQGDLRPDPLLVDPDDLANASAAAAEVSGVVTQIREEEERRVEVLAEIARLYESGLVTQEEANELVRQLGVGAEQVRKEFSLTEEVLKNLVQSIQRDLAATFREVLDEGVDGFDDLFDRLTDTFKSMIADWAAALVTQKFTAFLGIEGLSGLGGLLGGQGGQATGDAFKAAVSEAADLLKGAGGEVQKAGVATAAQLVTGGTSGGAAQAAGGAAGGAATAAGGAAGGASIIGAGATSGASLVSGGASASGAIIAGGAESAALLIGGAQAAAAQLAAGGAAGGASAATGGAAGGAAAGAAGLGVSAVAILGTAALIGAAVFVAGKVYERMTEEDFRSVGSFRIQGGETSGRSITESGQAMIDGIREFVEAFEEASGAFVETLPEIELEMKEGSDQVSAFVGGAWIGLFDSAAEAIDRAVRIALAKADIRGLGDELAEAIERDLFTSTEQLMEVVQILRLASDASLDPVIQDINEFDRAVDAMAETLEAVGISAQALGSLIGDNWQASRDAITGVSESAREQFQREREAFNARLAMEREEAEAKKATAEATIAATQAEIARLEAMISGVSIVNDIAGRMIASWEHQLDVANQALAEAQRNLRTANATLENLPDPISPSEFRDPGAASRERERERTERELRDLHDQAMGLSDSALQLRDSFDRFDDWIEAARDLGFAEDRLKQARQDRLQIESQDFLTPFLETLRSVGESGLETEIRQITESYAEALDTAMVLAEERAAAFGTTVEQEFEALSDVVRQALGVELAGAIRSELTDAVESGDLSAVREVIASLSDIPEDLRPETLAALGASADEMAAAVERARESFLDSVREYLDAAEGIGDFERQLLDLQDTFGEVREGLRAADEAAGLIEGLPSGEVEVPDVSDILDPTLDRFVESVRDAFGQIADAIEDELGVELPRGGLDLGQRPSKPTAGPDPGDVLAELPIVLGNVGDAADDLTDDLDRLEGAERRAVQALGVDFLGSLEELGVSLPTDLTLELAEAQFHLARAEAISSALALAAAGAFDDLSVSVGDILDMIAGADFDASAFAPGGSGDQAAGGGRSGVGRRAQELASFEDRLDRQIRAWLSLDLGPFTQEAIDLERRMAELELEADRLGASTEELAEAYRVARRSFIDEALAPFEDLDLSPLEADLQGLVQQFGDIATSFEVVGASQEEWLRLQEAFQTAMDDFWRRATSGIRALIDELERTDPRRTPAESFLSSQGEFRDLLARAQAGDLEAVAQLEDAARLYSEQAQAFLGGGVGSTEILDEILRGLGLVEDAEIVPEDVQLLRDQLEHLQRLLEVSERQPTQGSNAGGFGAVRDAIQEDQEATGDLLAELLAALDAGELQVEGIGDVLQTLGELVAVTDLSQQDLDGIFASLTGVIDVADTLGPQQLDSLVGLVASLASVENLTDAQRGQLSSMIDTLLGLETLTDAQRDVLLGLSTETGDQGGTLNEIWTKMDQNLRELKAQSYYTEPLLRSINIRAGQTNAHLVDINNTLSDMTQLATGGLTSSDGLAYLHAGELVLSPDQTAALRGSIGRSLSHDRLRESSVRISPDPRSVPRSVGTGVGEPGAVQELRTMQEVLLRSERRRSQSEEASGKLSAERLRQGKGEIDLMAAMVGELSAIRAELRKRDSPAAGKVN